MKWFKSLSRRWRVMIYCTGAAGVLLLVLLLQDGWMTWRAADRIYDPGDAVPAAPVALVLGTGKYTNGRINLFYSHRIDAAVALYEQGSVRGILVSGDNGRDDYNEPQMIRDDLIARGVPGEFITLDHAGFRTLDSLIRAREVFGQSQFIVISQRFHCERALYLADGLGLKATGFAASDVAGAGGFRVRVRETLARAMAFMDLHVFGPQARYLGPAVPVNLHQAAADPSPVPAVR